MLSVLLIGDSGVGKTSIMNRFSDDAFTNSHITTIGIDFKIRTIAVNGKQVKLQVWDTAGQERFHCITHSYYRKADGIVLVYDITDRNSFDNISRWLRNIEEYAPTGIVKILLGNKCDMPNRRVVSRDLAEKIAADHNIKFLETSAKANINIDNAFYDMAKAILEKQPDEPRTNRSVVNPHNGRENSAGGCCF